MQRHPQGGRGRLFLWATAFLVIGYLALVWGVFAVPVRRSPQPSADTGANHGGGLAASGAVAGAAGQENPVMACKSTKGDFTVTLRPDICPHAARQIASMVSSGFLSQGIAFWRVNKAITQFGADESHAARLKRGADDPFDAVRKPNLVLDPHPVCAKMGYLNSSSCKASKEPSLLAALKAQPWPRGTLACIGGVHLLVVRTRDKTSMGTAAHDCPVGVIGSDGMERVFDTLDDGYGNAIDSKGEGPDQRGIFDGGMEYVNSKYPLLDVLQSCSMSEADMKRVMSAVPE